MFKKIITISLLTTMACSDDNDEEFVPPPLVDNGVENPNSARHRTEIGSAFINIFEITDSITIGADNSLHTFWSYQYMRIKDLEDITFDRESFPEVPSDENAAYTVLKVSANEAGDVSGTGGAAMYRKLGNGFTVLDSISEKIVDTVNTDNFVYYSSETSLYKTNTEDFTSEKIFPTEDGESYKITRMFRGSNANIHFCFESNSSSYVSSDSISIGYGRLSSEGTFSFTSRFGEGEMGSCFLYRGRNSVLYAHDGASRYSSVDDGSSFEPEPYQIEDFRKFFVSEDSRLYKVSEKKPYHSLDGVNWDLVQTTEDTNVNGITEHQGYVIFLYSGSKYFGVSTVEKALQFEE